MPDFSGLVVPVVSGIAVAYVTARIARPAQKESAQQQQMAAVLQTAPALLAQGRELLTANAALQADILTQKNTIELLTDRVGSLEKDVKRLEEECKRIPPLEAENASLRAQLAVKEVELESARIERDAALRAQERAEGGLQQAQRTISEKVCASPSQD